MNRSRATGLLGLTVALLLVAAGSAAANPGNLDTGFSSLQSRVRTPVGSGSDSASAIAFSGGKLTAAGQSYNGSDTDFALVRYKSDGRVNTSFGVNGVVATDFGSGNDTANAIVVRSDGKMIVVGSASNGTDLDFAVARYNSNGSLDTSFSGDGKVMTDFGSGDDVATAVALQPDGKIVVAGYAAGASNSDFAFARYKKDGTLDTSFSGDGMQTVDFGDNDFAYGVALQSNGKIVAAGAAYNGSDYDTALVRLKANGKLDSDFSGDGKQVVDVGGDDFASAVAIQSNGRIVTAGRMDNGTNDDFSVLRFKSNGNQDTSFNGTGVQSFDFAGGDDDASSIALLDNGKILVGGPAYDGSAVNFGLARLKADGTIDSGFDGDGKAFGLSFGAGLVSIANGLALQDDGKIVLAGYVCLLVCVDSDFALERFSKGGSPDSNFTSFPGRVVTPIGSGADVAYGVDLAADGEIVAAGSTYNGSDTDFAVVRYKPSGALKTTFGTGGIVTTDFGSGDDSANAVAIDENGKIVAVGSAFNGSDLDFAVARYNSDGSLDTSFDSDGMATTDFGSGDDVARAVAIQPDGKIVVAGYASNGTDDDFAVARYSSDGSLDTSFSGDGMATLDFGTGNDHANAVVVQDNGRIVLGGYAAGGSNYDFALARFNDDGTVNTSYGTMGMVTTDFGSGDDYIAGLALQQDGEVVAAGGAWNGTNYDFGLARYTTAGTLDTSFDGDGMKTTAFGTGDDQASAVLVQPADQKIVAAGFTYNGTNYDFAVLRLKPSGSSDDSFMGGKVTTDFTSNDDQAFGLTLGTGGKLIAAGSTNNGTDLDFGLARYNG